MAKISTYPLEGNPKLSDKLIGTSVGLNQIGNLENPTYNFSLQQLLDLFSPLLPGNTLQGVLDNNNSATQDINLNGTIYTGGLEVSGIANIFSAYITDSLYIEAGLFDRNNSQGTAGQILTSTGSGVEWVMPIDTTPTLQEVLTSGNEADVDMILTSNLTAEVITANEIVAQDSFQLDGTLIDSNGLTGTSGQMLISLGTGVLWQDVPVYTASSPLFINPATRNITIQQANGTQNGYLSFADWINFDGKQNALSGTGIVVSTGGVISYITDNSFNWNRAYNDSIVSAAVTGTTTKTLTLTQRDGDIITASWSDGGGGGGISSIGLSMPSAFVVTNSPLTSNGTIDVTAAGTALEYIKGDGTLGTLPSVAGFVPYTGATADVDLGINDLTANAIIKNGGNSSQFLKADGSVDTNSYITLLSLFALSPLTYSNTTGTFSIQQSSAVQGGFLSAADWITFNNKQNSGNYITGLTGEATASGPGSASVVLSNAAVIAKVLTGLNVTGGSVISTDTILQAFGKLQNQINSLVGGSAYQGTWNASTNIPALASGIGTAGYYYIVNVAGSTNLDGITDWKVGDWAIFDGTVWQKVDNTDAVSSVNGYTGAVNLVSSDIPEGLTNLYFTDSRARLALSFAAGSGAYNNATGQITIPTDNSQILNGAGYITNAALAPYLLISTAASTYYPIPTGTTSQYVRGDGSLATFPAVASEAQRLVTEVYNDTGATLTKGTIVYLVGGQGNLPTVAKALATSDTTSAQTYGIVQSNITNQNNGYVVVIGSLTNLDTQVYPNGTQLYLSGTVAGTWTSVKPQAPIHLVYVAVVVRSHPTQGVVEVRIQNGYELDELHDVYINPTTLANGDLLQYNSSNDLWENKSISAAGIQPTLPTFTNGSVIFSDGTTLAQDNANFFWDDTNKRLGLGTTSPSQKLEINGTILSTDGSFGTLALGAISTRIEGNAATREMKFYTFNSEKMIIDGLGNVGIGTAVPTNRLDIVSSTNDNFDAIAVRPNNQSQVLYLGWQGIAASLNFIVSTNGSERMRVTTAGNFGIGTSSPTELLDVNGVIRGLLPDPSGLGGVTAKFLSFSSSPYGIIFRGTPTGQHSIQVQRESNDVELFDLLLQPLGGKVVIGYNTPINNSRLLVVGDDYQITLATTNGLTGIFCADGGGFPMILFDNNINSWSAFNGYIDYDVANSTFLFNNTFLSDINNGLIIGTTVLPNQTPYTTNVGETVIGVRDTQGNTNETGLYLRRSIYCSAFNTTTILTIAPPNSSIDLVAKIGYGSRFFIAKVSVMVDWNALTYTYKITSTNTTNYDDSDSLNINFEFALSGGEFAVQINNNTATEMYLNINANIL